MTIINVSPNRLVQIGYEGEDKVTILRFSYSDKWLENGDGIFTVRVLRNGENKAYDAQLIKDDRENLIIDMTVTDIELSKEGYGEMQLVYTGADFVKKSPVYKYYVSRAVDEAVDPPAQDVYTQIIESLSDLQTDVSGITGNIGDLSALTTEAKTDLVSAINEVNAKEGGGGGGGSVTVDDALSTTSTNPVQNKVITSAIRGKADTQTVSALADEVTDLDSDVQGLQTAMQSKVGDVQVNGVSIVDDGVANVPIGGDSTFGVFKAGQLNGRYGIKVVDGDLQIVPCDSGLIKNPFEFIGSGWRPIVPRTQHQSTFYGLAYAAGDTTQSQSRNAVGNYTEEAKSAISDMLNSAVQVEGMTPTITALSGVRYVCGEVATLDFTPCVSGICDVVFTSGSTPTAVTLPNTVKFPDGSFTAEANKTYEINILDGVYGVVMAWT